MKASNNATIGYCAVEQVSCKDATVIFSPILSVRLLHLRSLYHNHCYQ